MRFKKNLLLLLLPLFIYSCKDDEIDLIHAILPADDMVSLKTDTFHISASDTLVDKIPLKNTNSSWLLGIYTDSLFGVTTGEIFAQFNCPSISNNWPLPFDTISGSTNLVLRLEFESFIADTNDVLTISAYEMNVGTFSTLSYYSNIQTDLYTDKSILLGDFKDTVKNITHTVIEIPLNKTDLKDKLISESINNPKFYDDASAFINNILKGIYISLKSKLNVSAMMKIKTMEMHLKYAYPGFGSTIIDNEPKVFPASKEVRQVNRIVHDYSGHIPVSDSIVYVNSPAGINAMINIPLKRIKDSLGVSTVSGIAYVGSKKLSINNGLLTLEVSDKTISSLGKPPYLLMIKKSEKEDFFKNSKLPDNKIAIFALYNSTTASYSFDMRYYLANEFKSASMKDNDELEIIPVDAVIDSNNYINSVSYSLGLYGASLRTKDSFSPMKLNVLIAGF